MAFINHSIIEGQLRIMMEKSFTGKPGKVDVDIIKKYPRIKNIRIGGLDQELFGYFINNYGKQFTLIDLTHSPRIHDLKGFEHLSKIKELDIYWNQKAERFWDFSKNKLLKKFSFHDFSKLKDLSDLTTAKSLEELEFGDAVHSKFIIKSLLPIKQLTALKKLSFNFKTIEDNSFLLLAEMPNLEKISFPIGKLTTVEIAWLKARLKGKAKKAMYDATINSQPIESEIQGKTLDTFIVGKGKPWLSSKDDAARIQKYISTYESMVEWFENNPKALPSDYPSKKS